MHRPFRFAPPAPGPAPVLRQRLLGVLARRFDLRLITVQAGAGLGKTTVLAQALAENDLARAGRDAWVTCEPSDSTASTLLTALLTALGAPNPPGPPTVHDVCEAVWAAAPEPVCLVLDDAYRLEPASAGEAALQELLEAMPENGHLVVAGRRIPALPRSRLVLQGRAVELVDSDLLLDEDETASLAAQWGVAVDLLGSAGGWAALAALRAGTGVAEAERFAWEEVMAPLADDDRAAFLRLVAVGGSSAETLDAAIGIADRECLAGLPLVARDHQGGLWPHPLWEDLLRAHIDADDAMAARRRLADALRGRGEHGAAFELLAAAGEWDDALEVVFEACNDQRSPPWADQMQRWRCLLPVDRADQPEVRYLDAMVARSTDPWSPVARDGFADAIAGFAARGDLVREVTVAVRAAHAAWIREDRATLDRLLARGEEQLAAGVPVETLAVLNRATVADIDGDTATLRRLATVTTELEPRLRHFPGLLLTFAALAEGDADAAVGPAASSADAGAVVDPAAGTGWSALLPPLVAWARGDLAATIAAPPRDPGPRQSIAERAPSLMLAAVVAAHRDDVDAATSSLDTLDGLVADIGDRGLIAGCVAVAAATLAAAEGDEQTAATVLEMGLAGRALSASGAGRALRWLPAVPYLHHAGARAMLDELDHGPARRRIIDACRALRAARAGEPWTVPGLVDSPDALLTAMPPVLAVELVTRVHGSGAVARATAAISRLAETVPSATRRALHALAAGEPDQRAAARALLATVPIPPPHRIRIEVLGPSRLWRDAELVDDASWRRRRVRQLLGAMVAHREIRRAQLGVLLWPDFDEEGVSANLRMTLSYLQALVEPHRGRGDAPWFLRQDAGVLRLLAGEQLEVDAWELEDRLDDAERAARNATPSIELECLLAAIRLWRGDYLADLAGDDWAEPERERLRQRFARAAVRAGDLLVAAGRHQEAVAVAAAAAGADPWSEAAARLEITAHLAAGDQDAASASYRAALRRLEELGVSPGPGLMQLVGPLRLE